MLYKYFGNLVSDRVSHDLCTINDTILTWDSGGYLQGEKKKGRTDETEKRGVERKGAKSERDVGDDSGRGRTVGVREQRREAVEPEVEREGSTQGPSKGGPTTGWWKLVSSILKEDEVRRTGAVERYLG